jgi:hypothetical protein
MNTDLLFNKTVMMVEQVQNRHCLYNVTLGHIHVTTVAKEKQKVLNIPSVYL